MLTFLLPLDGYILGFTRSNWNEKNVSSLLYLCTLNIDSNMQDSIQSSLKKLNIQRLNPMQDKCIAESKQSDKIVLLSPTGSGKTLAFLLPILNLLATDKEGVQALVITPTRELAIQIEDVFRKLSSGFKVNACYGGHSMKIEINNLSEPPALLVGTPGRICDHLTRGTIDLENVHTIVLDEFDKCLEMGFLDQMTFISDYMPNINNRFLISATNMEEIPSFAQMNDAVELNFLTDNKPKIDLFKVDSYFEDKLASLLDIMCTVGDSTTIIFCNHRESVDRVQAYLYDEGIESCSLHGGMEQPERERALIKFRNESSTILVTTDLTSRGLDIPDVKYIIHYHLPLKGDAFIHRNGRTARMKASGCVVLLMGPNEELPEYIEDFVPDFEIDDTDGLPRLPKYATVYVGGGKKDKISKIDIVGFFCQKGGLKKDQIGLITVLDKSSFVAVDRDEVSNLLRQLKDQKIKGKKFKMALSS
jgi:superfamily II DNA/RNA helicase